MTQVEVYVYKEYNDEEAYGEEVLRAFSSKDAALKYLRSRVLPWAVNTFGPSVSSLKDLAAVLRADFDPFDYTVRDDYVSVLDGDACRFWIVEQLPVEDAA